MLMLKATPKILWLFLKKKKHYSWKLDEKDFEGYPLQSRKLKLLGRCLGIIQKVNIINYEQFKMIHFRKGFRIPICLFWFQQL